MSITLKVWHGNLPFQAVTVSEISGLQLSFKGFTRRACLSLLLALILPASPSCDQPFDIKDHVLMGNF